jgi:hypothetical protein
MLEADDDLASELRRPRPTLASEQKAVDADRKAQAAELDALKNVARPDSRVERAALVASLDRQVLDALEMVVERR